MYGMGSVWARYCLGFDSVLPSHRACPGLRGAAARQERGRDGRRADVRRDAPAASWRRGAPAIGGARTHARSARGHASPPPRGTSWCVTAPSSRYESVCAIRCVTTTDFMTADWCALGAVIYDMGFVDPIRALELFSGWGRIRKRCSEGARTEPSLAARLGQQDTGGSLA
jgi:hypothetical protein